MASFRGLVKAKKYDWKDSNMALFGSDTEKQVKKEAAETEPAWQGAGQEVGLKIWRIEQFEVKTWDEIGEFYNGDSYIILNTYKEEDSDKMMFDVHFWIGKNSTQDEYGTAAYKTVELDTFLDDAAVQHREVQGHESTLFRSYFPQGVTTLEGGVATGFKHVTPETYQPRLLRFNGKRLNNISVREVPLSTKSLRSDDVFILDLGEKFIQYNGSECKPMEKAKAMQYMNKLKSERGSADDTVIEEGSGCPEFFDRLGDDDIEAESDDEDDDGDKTLYRLNGDAFEEVKSGDITQDDFKADVSGKVIARLQQNNCVKKLNQSTAFCHSQRAWADKDSITQRPDVFLLETPVEVFVWVGANASAEEKRNGIPRAHKHMKCRSKFSLPITVVGDGQKSSSFQSAIAA